MPKKVTRKNIEKFIQKIDGFTFFFKFPGKEKTLMCECGGPAVYWKDLKTLEDWRGLGFLDVILDKAYEEYKKLKK